MMTINGDDTKWWHGTKIIYLALGCTLRAVRPKGRSSDTATWRYIRFYLGHRTVTNSLYRLSHFRIVHSFLKRQALRWTSIGLSGNKSKKIRTRGQGWGNWRWARIICWSRIYPGPWYRGFSLSRLSCDCHRRAGASRRRVNHASQNNANICFKGPLMQIATSWM